MGDSKVNISDKHHTDKTGETLMLMFPVDTAYYYLLLRNHFLITLSNFPGS